MAPGGPVVAGVYPRFLAWVMDMGFITIPIVLIGVAGHLEGFETRPAANGGTEFVATSVGWVAVLGLIASAIYCIGSWVSVAATPGQLIMDVRVHEIDAQRRLSLRAAAIRWFLLFGIFGLIGAVELFAKGTGGMLLIVEGLWLGGLLATTIKSPIRQGLHDKYARSVVVKGGLSTLVDALLTPGALLGQGAGGIALRAAAPGVPAVPRIAGLGRRAAAFVLDLIPLVVFSGVIAVIANVPGMVQTTIGPDGSTSAGFTMGSSGWSMVVLGVVSAVYCVGAWVSLGGTPGQLLLDMRVYRLASPARLGVVAAVVRWAVLWGVFCLLGALAVLNSYLSIVSFPGQLVWLAILICTAGRSSMKQGIHDQLAQSVVVKS